ncbi:transposase [Methylocystis sp. L43]|nr:transposase [Methylocystis sp. L43]MBG0807661.1 transposase [Methylocystis sp. H15]
MSRFDPSLEPNGSGLRRIEVITRAGGRRRWSEGEKALAVEESLAPDAVVSQVGRRHGATPEQLFTWRREARRRAEAAGAPPFVPAIAENGAEGGARRSRRGDRDRRGACVDLA